MMTDGAFSRAAKRGAFLSILAGSLFAYNAAFAQSTGSQTVEGVVVTAKRQISTGGLAVQVHEAKDQSVVTQDFIKTQVGSSNFAQLIDLLPGVSYSSEDPTGILSGDIRVHGFDGNHVSFTIDGTPINDTGNYAIFPGEYLAAEAIDHITVDLGQTEVDSPTASSVGGTVNIVTKLPSETPLTLLKASGGSYDYGRFYGEYDTGALGPTGIRSFLGVNYVDANKYHGNGDITRWGVDGRVYQPLAGDDFVSAAFTYASDRPDFYESSSRSQFAQFGKSIDFNTQWAIPSVTPGKADNVGPTTSPASNPAGTSPFAPGFEQGNDANYYRLHPNPVDFGDIRGQSRFDLGHNAILTVDPYLFYTLANGGGTTSLKESDPRLIGSGVAHACPKGGTGVDLNGDGDCLDTVLFYSPSNTQTQRYGVNASLIYDLNDDNRFQLAYTYDYGHHRQTGQFTPIDQLTGIPDNVFGGKAGYGPTVNAEDGAILRTRDRLSLAILNQISANYIGKFFDDRLHVNVGLRDPYFERDLNQFCYTLNGSTQYCDSVSKASVLNAYNMDIATHVAGATNAPNLSMLLFGNTTGVNYNNTLGTPNFRFPFKQTYNFNRVLPNAGASYKIDDQQSVYVTFAQGFSAPKTDDLYTSDQELVRPESSNQYGIGYRYQGPTITASINGWGATYDNRIVQSFDPNDPTLSIDRNVGSVDLYGLDVEVGWRATEALSFYASGSLEHSSLQDNYNLTVATGPDAGKSEPFPVKGKELVLTPDQQFALRAQYKIGDVTLGLQGKYQGRRFISDVNDDSIGGFTVFDFDAAYHFTVWGKQSEIAFNVYNLFDETYFTRTSTVSNTHTVKLANGDTFKTNTPFLFYGAPTTAYVTLKTTF
jgi:iron complex outermembrane recepter protein